MKIAYLHLHQLDTCYNKQNDGSYSFLDKEVGSSRGTFNWLDENYTNWFANNTYDPDVLCFNGKYYKYDGNRKSTLNDLKELKVLSPIIGQWKKPPDVSAIKTAEHECYCGRIKKGDLYYGNTCDLGCAYPGA